MKVGDSIHISARLGFGVTAIEPERVLLLHSGADISTGQPLDPSGPMPEKYLNISWAWYLEEVDERTTRLIVRFRQDYNPSLVNELMYAVVAKLGGFLMERKTLLGIKQRAEAA